jgi:hypothetical protein
MREMFANPAPRMERVVQMALAASKPFWRNWSRFLTPFGWSFTVLAVIAIVMGSALAMAT